MNKILRFGDRGEDVKAIQDALNFHIRRLKPLAVDGIFGPLTKTTATEFQKANQLQVDGIVGPQTAARLFETETVQVAIGISSVTSENRSSLFDRRNGIQPPRLIPQLTLPGFPLPVPLPPAPPSASSPAVIPTVFPILLSPSSIMSLPRLNSAGQAIALSLQVPSRNDPLDPALRSFNQLVGLAQSLPINTPFRVSIIGAIPPPPKKFGPLGLPPVGPLAFGFDWGAKPTFDVKKFAGPTEFSIGASARIGYTIAVIDRGGPNGFKFGIFAKGDFKAEFDYTSPAAKSLPLINISGSGVFGVVGRF